MQNEPLPTRTCDVCGAPMVQTGTTEWTCPTRMNPNHRIDPKTHLANRLPLWRRILRK